MLWSRPEGAIGQVSGHSAGLAGEPRGGSVASDSAECLE
jgi:hypothetical protein